MTVNISVWTNELRAVVPGCTSDAADQAIKATLREFYNKSGLWVETLEDLNATGAMEEIDLSAAAKADGYDANVISAYYIKYDDAYLKPLHQVKQFDTGIIPTHYYGLEAGRYGIRPTAVDVVADIMEARVVLTPAFTTDVVPNDAGGIWFDQILDGMLGRLYTQPNKTYTNLVQGQYHLRRFRAGIAEARDVARRRYTQTENSWTFPAWA